MESIEISTKQMQAVIALFTVGSSIVSGGILPAKQDTWICLVTAYLLSIPLLWVYSELLNLCEGRNFYDCILQVCGKTVGKILCLIYGLFTLHLGALVLRYFSEYIHDINLTETPMIAITAGFMAAVVYTMKNRFYVLARLSTVSLVFYILAFSLTIVLGLQFMKFDNIKPIFHTALQPFASSTFSQFAVPFGQLVYVLPTLGALDRRDKLFPVLLKGNSIGFLLLLLISWRNLFLLGYTSSNYMFSSYNAASVILVGDLITGLEVVVGIYVLVSGFVRICVLLFSLCKAFSTTFQFQDYEPLAAPCGLLMMTVSLLVHSNTEELFTFLRYYPVFSLPAQTLIPILLLILGKVRKKFSQKGKTKGKSPQRSPGSRQPT